MKLIFSEQAWEDYLYWQKTDKKLVQRINTLINSTVLIKKISPIHSFSAARTQRQTSCDKPSQAERQRGD